MVNNMSNGIGCVILGAGRSSRLGKPKALIEVEGRSLDFMDIIEIGQGWSPANCCN